MTTISIFLIGFSIIIAMTLLLSYVFFIQHVNKTWLTRLTCSGLLGGLSFTQFLHYGFYASGADPLSTQAYSFLILFMPPMFYFFSRGVLFPDHKLHTWHILHLLPMPLAFLLPQDITVPIAFLIGAGYCLWLMSIVYNLRSIRKRFELVFFFMGFFSVVAIIVLMIAFTASHVDQAYFYHFYSNGIGASLVLVTATLIVFPNVLNEIDEVVRLRYSNSTLNNVDVEACKDKLTVLMNDSKMYQNENLNIATVAHEMQLSNHQLSELINTQFNKSFSQYIRGQRVDAAKQLLRSEPGSSILSISMEVGFKSQSNFYAAFKEITGESPGHYRKPA